MKAITKSGWLSSRLNVIKTRDEAVDLYEDASRIPQSTTRAIVKERDEVVIYGDIAVYGSQTAIFLHAFEKDVPRVLKIPKDQRQAKFECGMFEAIGDEAKEKNIALVPVRLTNLHEHHHEHDHDQALHSPEKTLTSGSLMPSYSCTLSDVPTPISASFASQAFGRLLNAVQFINSKGWMHGDVKPSNIFISSDGHVWLGDYGSSVKYSDLSSFTGGTPMYQCEEVSYLENPCKFDCMGLVLSFLWLHGINLEARGSVDTIMKIALLIDKIPGIDKSQKECYLQVCNM